MLNFVMVLWYLGAFGRGVSSSHNFGNDYDALGRSGLTTFVNDDEGGMNWNVGSSSRKSHSNGVELNGNSSGTSWEQENKRWEHPYNTQKVV